MTRRYEVSLTDGLECESMGMAVEWPLHGEFAIVTATETEMVFMKIEHTVIENEVPENTVEVPAKKFIVNADHPVMEFNCYNRHVDVEYDPKVGMYWCRIPLFGCSKDRLTPVAAIADLLEANGCTNISVKPRG